MTTRTILLQGLPGGSLALPTCTSSCKRQSKTTTPLNLLPRERYIESCGKLTPRRWLTNRPHRQRSIMLKKKTNFATRFVPSHWTILGRLKNHPHVSSLVLMVSKLNLPIGPMGAQKYAQRKECPWMLLPCQAQSPSLRHSHRP